MILILGGTSDTHEYITSIDTPYIVSVATEYGYKLYSELYSDKNVIYTRFESISLTNFIIKHDITTIIDTTHPFATEITAVAKQVAFDMHIAYIDQKRKTNISNDYQDYNKHYITKSWTEAATHPILSQSSLLFTIGSKNLHLFRSYLGNAIVRVLDQSESIATCIGLGVTQDRIIAERGPFTTKNNVELIDKYRITCIVTKQSGINGGFYEKINAAISCRINILSITSPES